jgi:protein-S-isoprenylcysteine O-methyltransferase Ste14
MAVFFTYFCSAFWAILTGIQLRSAWSSGSLIPLLIATESALVGFRLVMRRTGSSPEVPLLQRLVAWVSLFLPLAMQGAHRSRPGEILALVGLLFTLWALWTLGPSFGIAPADRGLVTKGPYRFLRHPMYAGALLNALGFLVTNLNPLNAALFALAGASAILRIRWEEAVIRDYTPYAAHVRWRLVPGLW